MNGANQISRPGGAVRCVWGAGAALGLPTHPPTPRAGGTQEGFGREGGEGTWGADGEQDPAEPGLPGAPGCAMLTGVQSPVGSHCSQVCKH